MLDRQSLLFNKKGFVNLLLVILVVVIIAGGGISLISLKYFHQLTPSPSRTPLSLVKSNPVSDSSPIVEQTPNAQSIIKTIGDRENSFLIQKINQNDVEGLYSEKYPVARLGEGDPRTLHLGDDIGENCEGVSEKLTDIDYSNQRITFIRTEGKRPYGGCPLCLASNTKISTPDGDVNVKDLKVGMNVWSINKQGEKIISKILRVSNTPVPPSHQVIHIALGDGRELWVSPRHPITTGIEISKLNIGEKYDGSVIKNLEYVQYWDNKTYDLLPDSETGFYWANGILMASTLK